LEILVEAKLQSSFRQTLNSWAVFSGFPPKECGNDGRMITLRPRSYQSPTSLGKVFRMMIVKNIFSGVPSSLGAEEILENFVNSSSVRIERIISEGHSSPADFWYDQDQNEWVMLLQGGAVIIFEDKKEPVRLGPGDWIDIPAHMRHRVEWTDPHEKTIWLAIHY
jgi:cupin 2 domain-containing protein